MTDEREQFACRIADEGLVRLLVDLMTPEDAVLAIVMQRRAPHE